MKYSLIETINFADFINKKESLVDLNQLIVKEGCIDNMPVFTNCEVVLDMDLVEKITAKTENRILNKSMDSSLIIEDKQNKKVLLVEFRFNYVNMKNLDKNDLYGKVNGSSSVLNNISNIHNQFFFIFNSNLKYQAIRRLRNMVPSMPSHYVATDIEGLKNVFF